VCEGCCGGEEGVGEAGEGGGAGPFAVFFEDLLEADALGLDEAVEVADVVCAAVGVLAVFGGGGKGVLWCWLWLVSSPAPVANCQLPIAQCSCT
jgi:hypothetical protein